MGDVGVWASLTFPVSPVISELSPNCTFTLRSRLESEREGKATPKEATNKRLSILGFSFLKSALASAPGTFTEPLRPWPQGWWHLCPSWLPPDKGAGSPRDRLAGAQLCLQDQHTAGFCNCRSALMHQHRRLRHMTSPRERSKGLQDFTGCLPLGRLLPDPDLGAACMAGKGHGHFASQTAISHRLSLPPRACGSSGFAFPASRGSRCCQAAQRPCQILHLPSQPRSAEQTLSRRSSCAARLHRRAAGAAAAEQAGETGTL